MATTPPWNSKKMAVLGNPLWSPRTTFENSFDGGAEATSPEIFQRKWPLGISINCNMVDSDSRGNLVSFSFWKNTLFDHFPRLLQQKYIVWWISHFQHWLFFFHSPIAFKWQGISQKQAHQTNSLHSTLSKTHETPQEEADAYDSCKFHKQKELQIAAQSIDILALSLASQISLYSVKLLLDCYILSAIYCWRFICK